MIEKVKSIFSEKWLRITFLIFVLLRTIPTLDLVIGPLTKVLLVWGIILLVNDLFTNRFVFKNKFKLPLILFMIFYGITIVINYSNNFSSNVSVYLYLIIKIFVLYSYDESKEVKNVLDEIKIFNNFLIGITFLGALTSVIIVLVNFRMRINIGDSEYLLGFFDNRLFGVFGNPNTCGFLAVLSIGFTIVNLYLFGISRNKVVFAVVNSILQLSVLCLSGSRGGFLCFIIMTILFIVANCIKEFKDSNNRVKLIVSSLVIILLLPSGLSLFKKLNSSFIATFRNSGMISSEIGTENEEIDDFNRKEYGEEGSGRITIWKDGLKGFKENPVLGVGVKNIPNILVKYSSEAESVSDVNSNLHNEFLQVLVGAGAVGFIFIMIVFSGFIIISIKYITYSYKDNKINMGVLSIVIIMATVVCNNMVEAGMIFGTVYTSVILWSYFGYAMYLIGSDKEKR